MENCVFVAEQLECHYCGPQGTGIKQAIQIHLTWGQYHRESLRCSEGYLTNSTQFSVPMQCDFIYPIVSDRKGDSLSLIRGHREADTTVLQVVLRYNVHTILLLGEFSSGEQRLLDKVMPTITKSF